MKDPFYRNMFEDYVEKGADFPEFVIKGNCSKGNYFLNPNDYPNRYFKVNKFFVI